MTLFRTLLVLLLLLPAVTAVAQDEGLPSVHEIEMRRYAKLAKRADFVSAAAEQYDVHYYRLDVTLPDDPLKRFGGNVLMSLRSQVDDLTLIEYNIGASARVDSVQVNGTKLDESAITRVGDVIALALPFTLMQGQTLDVRTWYNFAYAGSAIDVRNVQQADLGKQILSIASQAEPYDARLWWPCKDDPADKADSVDIILTTAEQMFPVSNGVMASDVNNGDGTRTVTWHSRYPIVTYLVSVAAAEYSYR